MSYQNLIISFHVDLWLMSFWLQSCRGMRATFTVNHIDVLYTRGGIKMHQVHFHQPLSSKPFRPRCRHGQTQSARSPRVWPHGPQCNLVALFWCVWCSRCLMWLLVNTCIHWLHHAMVSMSFFSKFLILKGPNSFQTWAKNAIRLFFVGVCFEAASIWKIGQERGKRTLIQSNQQKAEMNFPFQFIGCTKKVLRHWWAYHGGVILGFKFRTLNKNPAAPW